MKLGQLLNELQGEIVGQKIPGNKIFDLKGNQVSRDNWDKSAAKILFPEILNAIKRMGLIKKFSPDKGDLDIKPYRKNEYLLSADNGEKFLYNVSGKRLTKMGG